MLLSLFYCFIWLPLAFGNHGTIILIERMYFAWLDKNYVDAYAGVKFVNRTQKAVFGNLTLYTPLSKKDSYVTFDVHKFTRNQYKPTVLQFKDNFHHALTSFDLFGIQDLKRNYITPVLDWPIQLNVTYRLREWVVDCYHLPPLIPSGEYKGITEIFLDKNKKIATLFGFYKVIEPLV